MATLCGRSIIKNVGGGVQKKKREQGDREKGGEKAEGPRKREKRKKHKSGNNYGKDFFGDKLVKEEDAFAKRKLHGRI